MMNTNPLTGRTGPNGCLCQIMAMVNLVGISHQIDDAISDLMANRPNGLMPNGQTVSETVTSAIDNVNGLAQCGHCEHRYQDNIDCWYCGCEDGGDGSSIVTIAKWHIHSNLPVHITCYREMVLANIKQVIAYYNANKHLFVDGQIETALYRAGSLN